MHDDGIAAPPDVSVIIATRDRAALLADTLRHLESQQPADLRWEVIVVDNGSRDATPDVLRAAASRLPLTALLEPRPGKNRAVNRGLAAARGRLVLFTDDDIIPDPSWIAEMAAASRRWATAQVFGGQIRAAFPPGTPAWLQAPFHEAMYFGRYMLDQAEGPASVPPNGANFAIPLHVLRETRFREDTGPDGSASYAMGSETELLYRLRARGALMIYVPSAVVHHIIQPHQLRTRYLLGRSYRSGRGVARLEPPDAVRLFGAPRYLWRQMAELALKYLLTLPRGHRRRLEAGLHLGRVVGQLAEHRSQTRTRSRAGA